MVNPMDTTVPPPSSSSTARDPAPAATTTTTTTTTTVPNSQDQILNALQQTDGNGGGPLVASGSQHAGGTGLMFVTSGGDNRGSSSVREGSSHVMSPPLSRKDTALRDETVSGEYISDDDDGVVGTGGRGGAGGGGGGGANDSTPYFHGHAHGNSLHRMASTKSSMKRKLTTTTAVASHKVANVIQTIQANVLTDPTATGAKGKVDWGLAALITGFAQAIICGCLESYMLWTIWKFGNVSWGQLSGGYQFILVSLFFTLLSCIAEGCFSFIKRMTQRELRKRELNYRRCYSLKSWFYGFLLTHFLL
jgi:hypothetical protein